MSDIIMECKQCHSKQLTLMSRFMTTAAIDQFSQDGKWHQHDSNKVVSRYVCGNGHEVVKTGSPKCPACDFQQHEDKIL